MPKKKNKRNFCLKSLVTSNLSPIFSTVDLFMGGVHMLSTLDLTIWAPQSAFSRSQMVTALAATQKLIGHLNMTFLVMMMRCCSIFRNNDILKVKVKVKILCALITMVLLLVTLSCILGN